MGNPTTDPSDAVRVMSRLSRPTVTGETHLGGGSSDNNNNNNSSERRNGSGGLRRSQSAEAPWDRDLRRTPRSVRTPPSKYDQRPTAAVPSSNIHRHRQYSKNPFDSSPSTAASSSRNTPSPPSFSEAPSSTPQLPLTRPTRINPFDPRPSLIRNEIGGGGIKTARSSEEGRYRNPFDSPSPTPPHDRASSIPTFTNKNNNNNNSRINPFDAPTPPPDTQPSARGIAYQDRRHEHTTRATNMTQGRNPPRGIIPSSPIKQDSVAMDSLEQILDTTDDTCPLEEDVASGDEAALTYPHPYQPRPHEERGRGLSHSKTMTATAATTTTPPPPSTSPLSVDRYQTPPPFSTPNTYYNNASKGSFLSTTAPPSTTDSTRSYTSQDTSPSDKALRAAETLRLSFQQRRHSRSSSHSGTPRVEVVLTDSRAGEDEEEEDVDTTLDGLKLEYSKTEEESGSNKTVATRDGVLVKHDKKSKMGRTADEEKKDDDKDPATAKGDKDVDQGLDNGDDEQGKDEEESDSGGDYALHDLCDEAPSTDDIAWRNALFLLTVRPDLAYKKEPECKMTPLHVACLAQEPPPLWFTRGLLYTAPATCRATDNGGRLPLHLLVATSADVDTIRLLVEEYPPSVAHRDDRGFTPLQLLLKNDQIPLTLEHLRLLLGQIDAAMGNGALFNDRNIRSDRRKRQLLFRKGEHLGSTVSDLKAMADARNEEHEYKFRDYPNDVRVSLNKITQWKRRQLNKTSVKSKRQMRQLEDERNFLRAKTDDFANSAALATPTGLLLPLHLLLRRKIGDEQIQDISAVKRASLVDLLRVLIAAHPYGLVGKDANGKTPLMTAMLQAGAVPSADVIELLLGIRTPGFDACNRERPAMIPTGDTYQLPLHVAAEELLSNYSLLSTIFEAYPDARTVQDVRGRTPLHLALQNYRSVPVDQATLSLLFSESVAKMKDDDGKTPFDLLVQNPKCVKEPCDSSSTTFQLFLDASIDKPKNRRESRSFLKHFRDFPPWLRRQASAARFVQGILLEEMASPFSTFQIMGSGFVIVILTALLRRLLHVNNDLAIIIYYLAAYHLSVQVIYLFTTIQMGECFRLCVTNIWKWIDLVTGILAIWCAYASDDSRSTYNERLFMNLGAAATASCWLSLLGYMKEWWCGVAVFVGSATQMLFVLVWPLCIAAMGIVATSQVLFTLEDCTTGGVCSRSEAYAVVYGMILGEPVLVDDYEYSTAMIVTIIVFTVLWVWWILTVVGTILSEAKQLDPEQLALSWFWERKVTLTIMATNGDGKISDFPSLMDRYCDGMEKNWDILACALRGEKSSIYWDACSFRSNSMLVITGCLALFILPVWFVVGLLTLGLLWPPQVRRWLYRPGGSTIRRDHYGRNMNSELSFSSTLEDNVKRAKLSQLSADVVALKAVTCDQNYHIQNDLGLIKEVLFRAVMDDE